MKCCSACTTVVMKLVGKIEEKSGPGAIIGRYRCQICWKGFDVQVDHPHKLNVLPNVDVVELIAKVRRLLGVIVRCDQCEREADQAAGKAIKANIVFHNCGRPN